MADNLLSNGVGECQCLVGLNRPDDKLSVVRRGIVLPLTIPSDNAVDLAVYLYLTADSEACLVACSDAYSDVGSGVPGVVGEDLTVDPPIPSQFFWILPT